MEGYNVADFNPGVLSNLSAFFINSVSVVRPFLDVEMMFAYLHVTGRYKIEEDKKWTIYNEISDEDVVRANCIYICDSPYRIPDRFKSIKNNGNEIVHKYIFGDGEGVLAKSDENEIVFQSRSSFAKEKFIAMLPVILGIDVTNDTELGEFCRSFILKRENVTMELRNIAEKFSKVVLESDWYKERVKSLLLNFSRTGYDDRVRRLKESLEYAISNKVDAYNNYMRQLSQCKKANEAYMLAKSYKPGKDTTLIDIFDNHDNLHFASIDKNYIKYSVVDTIEYFDEDLLYDVVENDDYDAKSRAVLEWMYVKDNGRFLAESSMSIENLCAIYPVKELWYKHPNAIRHPHLYEFRCPGDNQMYWERALEEGNYDVAIEQTIQATKNISWGDGAVVERLMDNICYDYWDKKCIMLNDGSFTSPRKVYEEELNNGKED